MLFCGLLEKRKKVTMTLKEPFLEKSKVQNKSRVILKILIRSICYEFWQDYSDPLQEMNNLYRPTLLTAFGFSRGLM